MMRDMGSMTRPGVWQFGYYRKMHPIVLLRFRTENKIDETRSRRKEKKNSSRAHMAVAFKSQGDD
jgi:hypothetical protein